MSGRSLSSGGVPRNPTFGTVIATSALNLNSGAEIYLYNTADQTTDYERGVVKWDTNAYVIGTEKGGTGSSRTLNFQVDGMSRWYITTAGHFQTTSSNGYDIGASGSLVRSLYYGTNLDGASGATFNLYNTADQTTNYERLRADWSSNVARIYTDLGGTGTSRNLRVGVGSGGTPTTYIDFGRTALPFFNFAAASTSGVTTPFVSFGSALTTTASAGTANIVQIAPTINQSSTAGYTAFDINPTETATGSGTKLLQRWAVGGTALAQIYSTGLFYSNNIYAYNTFGMSSTLGGTGDVLLNRDAVDTLALRRSTNAQTFRVYNTYTDASNYERANMYWSGNVFYIQPTGAGTGVGRHTVISNTATGSAIRWGTTLEFTSSLLASVDNTYDIGASGANRPRNVYVGGSLVAGSRIYMGSATVAGLPSAASSQYGHMFVTDSSVTASGNFGAIVAGGGANIVPVFSDGTNWRIG